MTKNGQKPHKFTDEELKRIVQYFDILIEIDQAEKARFRRLEQEPKGFSLPGEGRSCSLCRQSIYNEGFFDKWGFKCLNCQNAVNKRKIYASLCRDHKHEKAIPDTTSATKLDIKVYTLRKYIREGKIAGSHIPNDSYMILQKRTPF